MRGRVLALAVFVNRDSLLAPTTLDLGGANRPKPIRAGFVRVLTGKSRFGAPRGAGFQVLSTSTGS
jgi:hypothetical protein